MLKIVIFVHRWLGVALCLIFLLWFPSGIGMMYWDFPSVSTADRLERSPVLDPASIRVSPLEAYNTLGGVPPATQVGLNTFDGRPAYRVRAGRDETIVYADTGETRGEVTREMVDRIASRWTRQPVSAARIDRVEDVDQWTVQGALRSRRPLWKYSWPNGEQVYVAQATGEVVQYTTTASRIGAYLGAIPHWLYFTPLRKHQPQWSAFVIWTSGLGTIAAVLGLLVGVWMYSPSKPYRSSGAATSIPYRGQKRWHMIFGLIFGVAAATWAFSGMLSMDPFPTRSRGRSDDDASVAQALHGRFQLDAFAARHPRDAIAQLAPLAVKELELTSLAGEAVYLAILDGGGTRIVPMHGDSRTEFDRQRIIDIVTGATQRTGGAEIRVLDQYDSYYLDRHRKRPLPVILARLNDSAQTRYYIDPRTGRLAGSYSARNWMSRWLYHGLHSLDFPWLYNYRPAWDIVVITFMLGGTALCVTSLILAWRVMRRTLVSAATEDADSRMSSQRCSGRRHQASSGGARATRRHGCEAAAV